LKENNNKGSKVCNTCLNSSNQIANSKIASTILNRKSNKKNNLIQAKTHTLHIIPLYREKTKQTQLKFLPNPVQGMVNLTIKN